DDPVWVIRARVGGTGAPAQGASTSGRVAVHALCARAGRGGALRLNLKRRAEAQRCKPRHTTPGSIARVDPGCPKADRVFVHVFVHEFQSLGYRCSPPPLPKPPFPKPLTPTPPLVVDPC